MQIALNARILQAPRTGIGHYLAELVNALGQEPDISLSLFHGWGWSSQLPSAAMPGYSRLSPVLRQIPAGVAVLNPAFDVTPAALVSAIVSERGSAPASAAGLQALYPEEAHVGTATLPGRG